MAVAQGKRFVMDCRLNPKTRCTVTIAGDEEEVLDLAEHHMVRKHGFERRPQLREQLRALLKEEAYSL
ncbi:MAG: DUF1059 domain-containing protein [Elusimicrobia bacterium]|nr:DUF1059 domain-containing protein [Elusimicrobiota bacterium]